MKKIILVLSLLVYSYTLSAKDFVVFKNEYNILKVNKPLKKITVGNKDLINVSFLFGNGQGKSKDLKVFGKKSGSTSLMLIYKDNSVDNYHIYVNKNLGFIQKMVNQIAPNIKLQRVGDGSTVINGYFNTPHEKRRVYKILTNAGLDVNTTMDLADVKKIEKMVRTKLYLVEIDNARAKELGGAVGLGYVGNTANVALNNGAQTAATFSGFLLDNTGSFASKGSSLSASLKFLQGQQVANIMDDTVLLTTEEQNASFHVGGKVYIPTGVTFTGVSAQPMIQTTETEYGLRLTLKTYLLDKEGFVHLKVLIDSSEFDSDPEHEIDLGSDIRIPAFLSKNIQTDIVSKDGNVIALGGRMHTESIKQESKIPLLGDLPLIGWMFSSDVDVKLGKDLLFFLVPEIIDGNEVVDETDFYDRFQKEDTDRWNNIFKDNNRSVDVRNMNEKKKSDKQGQTQCDTSSDVEEEFTENEESSDNSIVNDETEVAYKEEVVPVVVKEVKESQKVVKEKKSSQVATKKVEDKVEVTPSKITASVEVTPDAVAVVATTTTIDTAVSNRARELLMKNAVKVVPTKIASAKSDEALVESVVNQKSQEKKVTKEKSSKKIYYIVKSDNTVVKSSAKNGFQIDLWDKGHRFSAVKGLKVNGEIWIKVKEDCMIDCEETGVPLWIMKKDTALEKDQFEKMIKTEPVAKTEAEVEAMLNSSKKTDSLSAANSMQYKVSAKRIFIRNAPKDGKKIDIWGKNHPFKSKVSKVIDGTKWLKIDEDCRIECKKVNSDLWISQRYVSVI